MNYIRIYGQLIERAKNRKLIGYCENHHIVPKSEGGTDNKDNLVKLTGREHFIAHKLLWMSNPTDFRRSAAFMMMSNHRDIKWGVVYETAREEFNNSVFHPLRQSENRVKQLKAIKGKPKTIEHRKKISEALKGKPKTKEHTEKMKASLPDRHGENNANYGKGRPVFIGDIEYPNIKSAAKSDGIASSSFVQRIRSDNFPTHRYK